MRFGRLRRLQREVRSANARDSGSGVRKCAVRDAKAYPISPIRRPFLQAGATQRQLYQQLPQLSLGVGAQLCANERVDIVRIWLVELGAAHDIKRIVVRGVIENDIAPTLHNQALVYQGVAKQPIILIVELVILLSNQRLDLLAKAAVSHAFT